MGWILTDDSVLHRIVHRLDRIEQLMTDAQTHLDAVAASLNEAIGNVITEIAALKDAVANGTPLDFTAVDASVSALQGATDAVESGETPPVTP